MYYTSVKLYYTLKKQYVNIYVLYDLLFNSYYNSNNFVDCSTFSIWYIPQICF